MRGCQQRCHIPRMVRGISERRPQFGHRLVQAAIEIHEGVGWPALFPQPLADDCFPRVFQKQRENLKGCSCSLIRTLCLRSSTALRSTSKTPKPLFRRGRSAARMTVHPRSFASVTRRHALSNTAFTRSLGPHTISPSHVGSVCIPRRLLVSVVRCRPLRQGPVTISGSDHFRLILLLAPCP